MYKHGCVCFSSECIRALLCVEMKQFGLFINLHIRKWGHIIVLFFAGSINTPPTPVLTNQIGSVSLAHGWARGMCKWVALTIGQATLSVTQLAHHGWMFHFPSEPADVKTLKYFAFFFWSSLSLSGLCRRHISPELLEKGTNTADKFPPN